ncbi:Cys-tRNA(Pro) deacylase [Pseudoalteromonas sp. McH1-7]|uniref:Cys-tRNA(Pro)/Cys-tRNA(Cys) deacylase n=1 Tax=Pseudoalteromonas peptidolytica F12-50-A1 TaxID=1315280 RepID=A0A8I0MYY4_9GAMM|nr:MULTISPECIES: Cys-tRNA(Pro) deacylase [Pseudoalteromonas]MBE0348652.1 putative transcription regulator [Pseudoalteromonas peptidolytica F12-50-A1]MDW7548524.1 Cys-tRNA(Pro) deacylase [Pseudoalteromonas peptidolytica]NLR15729.1 Cys-tRNA(Pro) deacylase [Pseudoalteromonas peptidolytica]NUZ12265.1 Cys-tRNA(Pro) deacylase [Pseudoalteromonas sp. McH1-7]RRS07566.1 Cys-tRNA(Pro) deacylase [Pseudoalteromonas sp. J010]
MTPAINLLKKTNVEFKILQFEHDPNDNDFANEAATKLNLDREKVFKTLLIEVDGQLYVAVSPATKQVDLKAFAKACEGKKAQLAEQLYAQKVTGYLVGGISPFAQKKQLPTLLHESALSFEQVYVSAGKRGVEVAISPTDIKAICKAKIACF